MEAVSDAAFRQQMAAALDQVRKVLDNTKHPEIPDDVQHSYDDKYYLAESLTALSASSQFGCLSSLGLQAEQLSQLKEWGNTRAVSTGKS